MKAARFHAYGGDVVVENMAPPAIGPDEVLVEVKAAALNPLDVKMHAGWMHEVFPVDLPHTIATDLAGVVVRVGDRVQRFRPGDHVVGRSDPTRGGAMAGAAAMPADHLVPVPAGLPLTDAAGIPTAAGTAWQALVEMAGLSAGQTVLVHAGAGGVGSFAIQFARMAGARVIATASGAGVDIARRLGAGQVLDYRTDDFAAMVSGVDVVLDTIGGETQRRSFGVLRSGGRLLAISEAPDPALAAAHGVEADFVFHRSSGRRLRAVVDAIMTAGLTVPIDRVVALDDLAAALRHQASGRARGKIIIAIG